MKKLLIIAITIIVSIGTTYKVNAEVLNSWSTQQVRIQTTHDGTDTWSSWTNINGDNSVTYDETSLTYPVKAIAYHLKASNGLNKDYEYSFRINYKPTPDSLHISSYSFENSTTGHTENVTCTQTQASSGYYWLSCSFSPTVSYGSNDYLYVKLNFYQSYLTELRVGVRGYEELIGTNAVITEQTENIINNQNQNTETIVNELQATTEQIGNQLMACNLYTMDNIKEDNKYLKTDGTYQSNNEFGITDYINVNQAKVTILETVATSANYCTYNQNKVLISCTSESNLTLGELTLNDNVYYIRFSIRKSNNKPKIKICKNGNQALLDTDHTYNGNTNALDTAITTAEAGEQALNQLLGIDQMQMPTISINTEPSNFIWTIVTTLKEINAKVTLLFMTILGLGVMKMILNR